MKGFILYNGPKNNIEVSLLIKEAKNQSIELSVVNPREISIITGNDISYIRINGKKETTPDFVLAGFVNDFIYSNFAALQQLEEMGVFCVNTSRAILTTEDKILTSQKLVKAGLTTPKSMLISPATTVEIIEEEFTYPIVLKTTHGGKGSEVFLIKDKSEMKNISQLIKTGTIKKEVLLQEMIETSKGRDVRVMVIGKKAVCCMLRKSMKADEFRANFSLGGTTAPCKLTEEMIEMSNKTAEILNLFVGGIDLLFTDEGFTICEANSVPGFYLPNQGNPWGMDIPKSIITAINNELLK